MFVNIFVIVICFRDLHQLLEVKLEANLVYLWGTRTVCIKTSSYRDILSGRIHPVEDERYGEQNCLVANFYLNGFIVTVV